MHSNKKPETLTRPMFNSTQSNIVSRIILHNNWETDCYILIVYYRCFLLHTLLPQYNWAVNQHLDWGAASSNYPNNTRTEGETRAEMVRSCNKFFANCDSYSSQTSLNTFCILIFYFLVNHFSFNSILLHFLPKKHKLLNS